MAKNWTYEKSGVPHLKGDPDYNRKIASLINRTRVRGVCGRPGGFSSLFDLRLTGSKDPILVSTTDGVGTKLEVAARQGRHDTIGVDLVAMCVNDLITTGARPLFFLDYFATGKFEPARAAEILEGIVKGCREAGCALAGGETAVMPGFYAGLQYDLAGFAVGVVERRRLIDGKKIKPGHRLLGLASNGFHSNGYSLLRKIFSPEELSGEWGRELLMPTRIYVKPVLKLMEQIELLGIANITGGGLYDNLPRILPAGLGVRIDSARWPRPKLFDLVQVRGSIRTSEMFRTFNMGIGMVWVVDRKEVPRAKKFLSRFKIQSWEIGEAVKGKGVEIQ